METNNKSSATADPLRAWRAARHILEQTTTIALESEVDLYFCPEFRGYGRTD